MDEASTALRNIANRWRTKSSTSPLPDVTNSSRKMAMGAMPASVDVDETPLKDLNNALRGLVELFPNVQPEVFREMLLNTAEESRLQMVIENLLRDESRCVRGRVRGLNDANNGPSGTPQIKLKADERFRNISYKTAVTDSLSEEFKGVSKSVIRALLAECNYSYAKSRERLLEFSSKSWRYSVTSFFFRRKLTAAGENPLVVWEPCRVGSAALMQPTLRFTPSTELNLELWGTLIQPVLDQQKLDQQLQDRQYALKLTEEQAEKLGEIYDCGCCFTSYPMEQLSGCTDQGHYICRTCIRHTTNEALFGQGWATSIDHQRCTVKCVAPESRGDVCCEGFIPAAMVQLALDEDNATPDLWERLQDRCAAEALLKSRLPLVRCPFCTYAELDDFDVRKVKWTWPASSHFYITGVVGLLWMLLVSAVLRYIISGLAAAGMVYNTSYVLMTGQSPFSTWLEASLLRLTRKRRGLRFTCGSPRCGRASCLNCHKAWSDVHICYESSKLALRATIEAATTEVVKRTCPVCSLSFVKAAGCNKLACVCGYTMCYVCRQQIGKESYSHFCQHFRQRPGEPCHECDRCDLYKVEDEDAMVREAALRAEKEWWEREESAQVGPDNAPDRAVRRDHWEALEEATLPLTSSGKFHAYVRRLGSKARWERTFDRMLSDFVE